MGKNAEMKGSTMQLVTKTTFIKCVCVYECMRLYYIILYIYLYMYIYMHIKQITNINSNKDDNDDDNGDDL